jgi:molybdenum cofactor cytidylyltransferase
MARQKIGIIVLAAGGSSRLGKPKQLLQIEGKSLLRRSAEMALASGCEPVIVVLGASALELTGEIGDLPVEFVINDNWQQGMSSSLKLGLSQLVKHVPDASAAVIMLCDQVHVSTGTLQRLIDSYELSRKPIVAAHYNGTIGVPALFAADMFDELMMLERDAGAKAVINRHLPDSVATIDAPEAEIDLDTIEQYLALGELAADTNSGKK